MILVRELLEETGVAVDASKLLGTLSALSQEGKIHLPYGSHDAEQELGAIVLKDKDEVRRRLLEALSK